MSVRVTKDLDVVKTVWIRKDKGFISIIKGTTANTQSLYKILNVKVSFLLWFRS